MAQDKSLPLIGWREWLALPDLGISRIKVKVDTGARSSALHAYDIEPFTHRGQPMVRFTVHPLQRDNRTLVTAEAPLLDRRAVRSSVGHATMRPVIVTPVRFLERIWEIEVSLIRRDEMGFRMLLGRQAIRGRFAVDPGKSYYGGRPKRKKKKVKKSKSKRPRSSS